MKTASHLPALLALLALAAAAHAAPLPSATAQAALAAREQRAALLRDELKALDDRIETRIDALVAALSAIGDSKDSCTKVARMKERTIGSLKNTIAYYQTKRAAMQEELRRPTLRLTDEQKRRAIAVFDARIEKRVAQILALQKSLPTAKEYDRYEATGSTWAGTQYTRNDDYDQNRRVTAVTNSQRREIEEGLRHSIARLEQQNRSLRTAGAPAEEIATNDALIAERKKQLAVALAPVATLTRQVGGNEAADLDQALLTAVADLKGDFTTLFARYHALIQELSAVNATRDALQTPKAP